MYDHADIGHAGVGRDARVGREQREEHRWGIAGNSRQRDGFCESRGLWTTEAMRIDPLAVIPQEIGTPFGGVIQCFPLVERHSYGMLHIGLEFPSWAVALRTLQNAQQLVANFISCGFEPLN